MASAVYPYNAKAIIVQLRSVLVCLAFGGMSRVLPRAWPLVGPMSYSVTVGWSLSVWDRFFFTDTVLFLNRYSCLDAPILFPLY